MYHAYRCRAVLYVQNLFGFSVARGAPALPSTTRPPRGRVAAPCPPHTAVLGVPDERTRAVAQLAQRGAWKGALPGKACLVLGKGRDLRERRGSRHFRRHFPPGIFFVSSILGFCMYGRIFSGNGTFPPPSGIFCLHPRFLAQAVERSTLNTEVPGSSPTFRLTSQR